MQKRPDKVCKCAIRILNLRTKKRRLERAELVHIN